MIVALWLLACAPARALGSDEALLTRTLRGFVKVLVRSIDTYHCAPLARVAATAGPLDQEGLRSYLEHRRARYWDTALPVGPSATASGLYAGVDPVTCRHFGGVGDGWALIRIRLPAGLTFLDLRREQVTAEERPRLPLAVVETLQAAGCDARDPPALVTGRESNACREAALSTVRRLEVEAILVDLPALRLPGCERSGNGAFILVDGMQAPFAAAALFTSDVPVGDAVAVERSMIRELYVQARRAGSSRVPPWPEARSISREELSLWMEDHLWSCGTLPQRPVQ